MTAMHRSKTWRTLCWLLTLALVGMVLPAGLAPVAAQDQAAVRTFLVLPAQDNSGAGLDYLSRLVSDEVVLAVTGRVNVSSPPTPPISLQATWDSGSVQFVPLRAYS